jgi:hypothetical protein
MALDSPRGTRFLWGLCYFVLVYVTGVLTLAESRHFAEWCGNDQVLLIWQYSDVL